MKRNILLPTDFSYNSIRAIKYAIEIFNNEDCCFYLLNVFSAKGHLMQNLMNMDVGSALYENTREDSEKRLNELMDQLILDQSGDVKHIFRKISMFNDTLEAIKHVVEQKDIEMIVMGTKGETNNTDVRYGSIAVQVMEKVRNCPVIVVPEKSKLTMPIEIVFPTAFKIAYKKRELQILTDVASRFNAHIIVLHITEKDELTPGQEERKQYLKEILAKVSHKFKTIHHDDIESGINLFIESRDGNMLAFINKKHAFFGSFITKPLVKKITFQSRVPILVMHDLKN